MVGGIESEARNAHKPLFDSFLKVFGAKTIIKS